jgi:hypothetical protein
VRRIRDTMGKLLARLLLALLAFPPVFIAMKYWRWCARQEKEADADAEES